MLTQRRLKFVIIYDPETGLFKWRDVKGNPYKGTFAGSHDSKGYLVIRLRGNCYKAHRLASFVYEEESVKFFGKYKRQYHAL